MKRTSKAKKRAALTTAAKTWPQNIRQPLRGRMLRDAVMISDAVVADIVTAAYALRHIVGAPLPTDDVERRGRDAALEVVSIYLWQEAHRLDERQTFTRKLASD